MAKIFRGCLSGVWLAEFCLLRISIRELEIASEVNINASTDALIMGIVGRFAGLEWPTKFKS